ncbi:PAS domain-containing protein [Hymenobacter caeli]|uniref:histidine kinase n=1 Tax=Hymenobacter caeli TaxID=2735894 RepID=A0ABX2FNK0_9BACT|nr:PAS domain-containing protein [Hymenobacter caeli]NRT18054.1 PAS domain S-box-containing protein [Hymenobacter caeli]
MADFAAAAPVFSADVLADFPLDGLLAGLFDAAPTGLALCKPVRGAGGEIVEFAFALLNGAAQRRLGLPARPTPAARGLGPGTAPGGAFELCRDVFEAGQPGAREFRSPPAGPAGPNPYHCLAARRVGQGLLVSFAGPEADPRPPAEPTRSEADAREQAARAAGERNQLRELIDQAPVAIGLFEGPELRVTAANRALAALWDYTPAQVLGRPLLEAVPELRGQGFDDLLRRVLETRVPFVGNEVPARLRRDGRLTTTYYNFVYQPLYAADGSVLGVVNVAMEVTEQVRARQLVEEKEQQTNQLNEELAATNEELQAANEELAAANEELQAANEEVRANNVELFHTQQALRELNQQLEARVADRTAQLQAARAEAEHQRARLHRLFMQAPAAVCILDGPELVFELVNPGYRALFPGRRLAGRPLLHALPELAGQSVWHTLRRVYATGETHQEAAIRVPVARHEGGPLEDFYLDYIQQARYDEQGRVDGVLVFAFDVTAQVRARQASEASARQLRVITDALPVLIGYLDQQQRFQFANRAYEAWFDQKPADLLGRPLAEIATDGRYESVRGYLERALAGEHTEFDAQMTFSAGAVRHLRTAYLPDVQDGRVAGCFTLATDVTDQVVAREQVQRLNQELAATNQELQAGNQELGAANRQLQRINQDLDNFVYAASHDLKQPVNNLTGLFEELRRAAPAAAGSDAALLLDLIDGTLRQLTLTINDLADVGQVQQGANPAEAVPLAELAEEVLATLHPQVLAARARVTTDFSARPTVSYPRAHLRIVLLNLLGNALKYADPARPARVRLSLWVQDGAPVLLVEDNGLGFDVRRHQGELFQLFRRFHTHTEGTGVGLYLVNRIVQGHGGRLEVESEVGEGTTFRVYLGGQ